jgi:hypothetical protein
MNKKTRSKGLSVVKDSQTDPSSIKFNSLPVSQAESFKGSARHLVGNILKKNSAPSTKQEVYSEVQSEQ